MCVVLCPPLTQLTLSCPSLQRSSILVKMRACSTRSASVMNRSSKYSCCGGVILISPPLQTSNAGPGTLLHSYSTTKYRLQCCITCSNCGNIFRDSLCLLPHVLKSKRTAWRNPRTIAVLPLITECAALSPKCRNPARHPRQARDCDSMRSRLAPHRVASSFP